MVSSIRQSFKQARYRLAVNEVALRLAIRMSTPRLATRQWCVRSSTACNPIEKLFKLALTCQSLREFQKAL